MTETKPNDATEICEDILRQEQRYNLENEILPTENAIIDRLLKRGPELIDAYLELHRKLSDRPNALKVMLGVVVTTAAFWSPADIDQARAGRERLRRVNYLIASQAAELATLFQERSHLHDHSGFAGDTHYHVCQVIEDAAATNHLFGFWVKKELGALRSQFGLKYWPSLSDFMSALARDAENTELEATDPITAAATDGSRRSKADFFKALFEAMEENSTGGSAALPVGLKLTDNAIASLANCALDLGPDEIVDGAYVKRLRQRKRDHARKSAGNSFWGAQI